MVIRDLFWNGEFRRFAGVIILFGAIVELEERLAATDAWQQVDNSARAKIDKC
jgi:hypothetical protein